MEVGFGLKKRQLRNHLKWARLKVRGDGDSAPNSVQLVHEGLTLKVQIWVETPARVVYDERTPAAPQTTRGPKS